MLAWTMRLLREALYKRHPYRLNLLGEEGHGFFYLVEQQTSFSLWFFNLLFLLVAGLAFAGWTWWRDRQNDQLRLLAVTFGVLAGVLLVLQAAFASWKRALAGWNKWGASVGSS